MGLVRPGAFGQRELAARAFARASAEHVANAYVHGGSRGERTRTRSTVSHFAPTSHCLDDRVAFDLARELSHENSSMTPAESRL
jgi:hypothetical protein